MTKIEIYDTRLPDRAWAEAFRGMVRDNDCAALSCNGMNLIGDHKSIDEARRLIEADHHKEMFRERILQQMETIRELEAKVEELKLKLSDQGWALENAREALEEAYDGQWR